MPDGATLTSLQLFGLTYGAVFFAELTGDKTLYAAGALTLRYRWPLVAVGMGLAFAGKIAVAVAFGSALKSIGSQWVIWINAATLLTTAVVLWRRRQEDEQATKIGLGDHWARDVCMSFAAVFFTEWLDFGQVTTAVLAAQYAVPLVIGTAALAALMTKGVLAILCGIRIRRFISPTAARQLAAGSCAVLGIITLAEGFGSLPL